MDINNLHPNTITVLDLKLNQKNHSSRSGAMREGIEYVTDTEYSDTKGKVLCTIPYQAEQLLEQAAYLIQLANHCVENNVNIQY